MTAKLFKSASAICFVIFGWSVAPAATPAPSLQRPAVEKRFEELEWRRAEAETLGVLRQQLMATTIQIVSRDPNGPLAQSAKNDVKESTVTWCTKESTWKRDFQNLEAELKKANGGDLPAWVMRDRNWQTLDQGMKKSTVKVKPEQCRPVVEQTLKD